MDYTISEDKLFEILSKFMEKLFPEMRIVHGDRRDDRLIYIQPDGKQVLLGIITYNRYGGEFILTIDYDSWPKFKTIRNTFGDEIDNLIIKYFQNKFPEYNISLINF